MTQSNDVARLQAEYARRDHRLKGSDTYSLFNSAYLYTIQQRQRDVLRLLKKYELDRLNGLDILEVGCGTGGVLLEYLTYGACQDHLHGVDVRQVSLGYAQDRLPRSGIVCADGQGLPYSDGSFDLVLQYTAFSSLLNNQVKIRVAQEMLRVLRRPRGMILWYDFWLNPTNPQTRGIGKREIRTLFPACSFEFQQVTLAPPISRRLVRVSRLLCMLLERTRVFNSHYLVAIQANEVE